MASGRIKVRQRNDGKLSRYLMIPGRQLDIPKTFVITLEMNGEACEYEVNDKGAIVKIVVAGKEVAIDTALLQTRIEKQQQAIEEEARKKQEQLELRKKEQQQGQNRGGQALRVDAAYNPSTLSRLPKDVRVLMGKPDNLYLHVFKAANFWSENKNKATLFQFKRGNRKLGTTDQQMRHLPEEKLNYGQFPFTTQAQQQVQTVHALYPQAYTHHHYRTQNRLVTGIGGASVFEVGFTLHHIYGFPYIPASSIKGVVRSWYIQQHFVGKEENALKDRIFCDLFGCPAEWIQKIKEEDSDKKGSKVKQLKHPSWYALNKQFPGDKGERKGQIIFFDAYPVQAPQVEDEVMNVHYPDYYQGKELPTDYQLPVPIAFLAVAAQTTFQFVLATDSQAENAKDLLQTAETALHAALTEHGIGAKTAVGYGFMEKINV